MIHMVLWVGEIYFYVSLMIYLVLIFTSNMAMATISKIIFSTIYDETFELELQDGVCRLDVFHIIIGALLILTRISFE